MSVPAETQLRVLLAVGDRERERTLTRELGALQVAIVGRALDAPTLVGHPVAGVDVALVSADLHRLGPGTLGALRERGLPVVLLVTETTDAAEFGTVARPVTVGTSAAELAQALHEAASRGPLVAITPDTGDAPAAPWQAAGADVAPRVIAVTSGKGAPGKTTVAIALAAALARADSSVALVDADLRGGNVASYLDLDPRRGLVGLRGDAMLTPQRVGEELQDGPGCAVLAGVERAPLAADLEPAMLVSALETLGTRFERVVIDLGSYGEGAGAGAQEALLRAADQTLLVSGADLVSVWNAQVALRALRAQMPAMTERFALVLNRREGREHYDPAEIERSLGVPVLAAIGEDRRAARRAIERQQPLSDVGGRAARELRALARGLSDDVTLTVPARWALPWRVRRAG